MSITGTDIAREAFRLMGRPSQDEMPYQDLMDNAHTVMSGGLFDLKISNRNRTPVIGSWRTPTARNETTDKYTDDGNMFIPVRCEWRLVEGDDTQVPMKAEFTSIERINDYVDLPQSYVALYNNDSEIMFSDPVTVLANREYRLYYEDLADVEFSFLGEEVDNFPDAFVHWGAYKTADISMYQVKNDSEAWMAERDRLLVAIEKGLMEWEQRLDTWRRSRFGNRVTKKRGWQPIRSRRRRN